MIKEKYPKIYSFLREVYHTTPFYKNKIKKHKVFKQKNDLEIIDRDASIMNTLFNNNFLVLNGPFKGMKYINKSSCSKLLPKILGSYEEPIQDWIIEIITKKKYTNILDIGSAEGYYAVGFALKLPNANIIAYDTDDDARKNLKELIYANKVNNVEIKNECSHEELNTKCKPNTLIFCDIEGFEKILLDPIKVPNLKNIDLIVETHDCFVPNVSEELIKRFYMTHTMRIIVDYPYRINQYSIPKNHSTKQFNDITDEKRSKYMKFIYMKSNYGKL
jgi:hypothetical protein